MAMSSNLVWKIIRPSVDKDLSTGTKFVLRKFFGEPIHAELGQGNMPYLRGVLDASTDELVIRDITMLIKELEAGHRLALDEVY
jgi:hypothetical protein